MLNYGCDLPDPCHRRGHLLVPTGVFTRAPNRHRFCSQCPCGCSGGQALVDGRRGRD